MDCSERLRVCCLWLWPCVRGWGVESGSRRRLPARVVRRIRLAFCGIRLGADDELTRSLRWLVPFVIFVGFDCPFNHSVVFVPQSLGCDHAAAAAPAVLTALAVAPAVVDVACVCRAVPERRPAASGTSHKGGGGGGPLSSRTRLPSPRRPPATTGGCGWSTAATASGA